MANESEESGPAGLETSATAATAQSEEDSVKEKNKKLEEGGEKMPPNEATADVPTAENATSAASEAAAAAVDVKTPLAEDDPPQVIGPVHSLSVLQLTSPNWIFPVCTVVPTGGDTGYLVPTVPLSICGLHCTGHSCVSCW